MTITQPTADSQPPEVLCVGETMLLLSPDAETLLDSEAVRIHTAGAESNVAVALAHLGHSVEWFSRVGADPIGERVLRDLAARGVATPRVVRDEARRTGIYLKDWAGGASNVYYYREGSAASALGVADLAELPLEGTRACHFSGINLALSASFGAAMHALVARCRALGAVVSFDVNFRPGLWDRDEAAPELLELARLADIVIVGRDEAEALWSTPTAADVRALLPTTPMLLVKDAEIGATLFTGATETFVPALSVDVIEPIGAGDAFAAGFLSGWLRGAGDFASLRLGHALAAQVLRTSGDTPHLPSPGEIGSLAALSEDEWAATRIGPRRELASTAPKGHA